MRGITKGLISTRVLAGLGASVAIGCGPMDATLEIGDGSRLSIEPPEALAALVPSFSTDLTGTIDGAIDIELDLGNLLRLQPTEAELTTDRLRIAGTGFELAPGVDSGTLCTTLDPANLPRAGIVSISLLRDRIEIEAALPALVQASNPEVASLIPPIALELPVQVRMPFTLADTLAAAPALLNGGAIDLEFSQPVDLVLGEEVELFAGARVTGNFNVRTADTDDGDDGPRFAFAFGDGPGFFGRGADDARNRALLEDCAAVFEAAEAEIAAASTRSRGPRFGFGGRLP